MVQKVNNAGEATGASALKLRPNWKPFGFSGHPICTAVSSVFCVAGLVCIIMGFILPNLLQQPPFDSQAQAGFNQATLPFGILGIIFSIISKSWATLVISLLISLFIPALLVYWGFSGIA